MTVVYSWGSGNLGQLGIGNTDDSVSTPTLVKLTTDQNESGDDISDIVGGGCHTMMLYSNGDLYVFGSNESGQLGIPNQSQQKYQTTPIILNYFKSNQIKIVNCSGGWNHSLATDTNGNIYSWGSNSHNQLGINTSTTIKPIKETNNYTPIANTITKRRLVFKNKKPEKTNIYEPTLVDYFTKEKIQIVSVSCGMRHSISLSNQNLVYGWGCNKFGQLSNKIKIINSTETQSNVIMVEQPSLIELNINIIQISCGFQHTLLLDDNKSNIITFGQNKFGQLGNGTTIDSSEPIQISLSSILDRNNNNNNNNNNNENYNIKIKEIQSGWSNSCILLDIGKLLICGRGEFGILGDGNESLNSISSKFKLLNSFPFNDDNNNNEIIKNFSIGSEHVLIQTNQNNIYSFGWNEHYQLGLCEHVVVGVDGTNQSTPKLLPSIKGNSKSKVKVGSGHSFLILPSIDKQIK